MLFKQIAGQEDIKKYLIKSIVNNTVCHGYIFEGPKSIGKYELALVFAQSILCKDFNLNPCNICNSCKKVNSSNHPDIHIINNSDKNIKRESIDEIINSVYKKPYESDKKIYIINNSNNMTTQAANTFLKTLEEPPNDTIIILLTTNSNLLIPTIVSRCQLIKFRSINKNEIVEFLMQNYKLDKQKANIIADYSKGILNKAVRITKEEDNILQKRDEIVKVIDKVLDSDEYIIYKYEEYFDKIKNDISDVLELIMIWMRDILFVKKNMGKYVINKDYIELLEKHSKITTLEAVLNMIQYLQDVNTDIKNNVNYKLVIDKMLLRLQGLET